MFTFGGLKVDARAQVLNQDGVADRGLYAAGEIIGIYYKNYTGATSVLKGAVFGRIAGMDTAKINVSILFLLYYLKMKLEALDQL